MLYYSDNELLYYDNRSVQQRFITSIPKHPNNIMIKSTVRGNLKNNYWKKSESSHTSLMKYKCCNSIGKIISYDSSINHQINYNFVFLKHYYTKSVEEYCNKTKRGEAFFDTIDFDIKRKIDKINQYFFYNKKTKEKLNLFLNLFSLNTTSLNEFEINNNTN